MSRQPMPSSTTGSSASAAKDEKAMAAALYDWCQKTFAEDQLITQEQMLQSGIVPAHDKETLLHLVQSLINDRLLTSREFSSGSVAWLIVPQVSAAKYKTLSSDEGLVYRVIESAGRAGAWLKTIKSKLNLHQKNVDSSIKTLLQRGYIKSMASVKYPNRKMYILASLQPSEDATGGAWFTDGVLDQELLEEIGSALEWKISKESWMQVDDPSSPQHKKRKEPDAGFDADKKGKQKTVRLTTPLARDVDAVGDETIKASAGSQARANDKKSSSQSYCPYPAGYADYPTLKQLTAFINESNLMQNGKLAENDISQLLDVMMYDDKIDKIVPPDRSEQTTYKARKTPAQLTEDRTLENRIKEAREGSSSQKRALRELELKKLDGGGMTEVPCGRCPVFDMCEVGGPVNPDNCQYFDAWFTQLEDVRSEEAAIDW